MSYNHDWVDALGCRIGNLNGQVDNVLHKLISAIYFDDSSDYRDTILSCISIFDEKLGELCQQNPKKAFHKIEHRSNKEKKR